MAKIKRLLSEEEDRLLSELRNLQSSIVQEAISAAVEVVKDYREKDVAYFTRGEMSMNEFMVENFGERTVDEQGDDAGEIYLIDFN